MKKIIYSTILASTLILSPATVMAEETYKVIEGSHGMMTTEKWQLVKEVKGEGVVQRYISGANGSIFASIISYEGTADYDSVLLGASQAAKESGWTILEYGEISQSPKTFLLEYNQKGDPDGVEYMYIVEMGPLSVEVINFRIPKEAYKKGLFNKLVSSMK